MFSLSRQIKVKTNYKNNEDDDDENKNYQINIKSTQKTWSFCVGQVLLGMGAPLEYD